MIYSYLCLPGFVRYSDNEFEYRHVQLPKEMIKRIPKDYFDPSKGTLKLLWEEEWRGLGITQVHMANPIFHSKHRLILVLQSLGWEHYEVHEPEPHILLFKYVYFQALHDRFQLLTSRRRPINYQPPIMGH